MTFNTLGFALFLPIVFVLYWLAFNKSAKAQNILLLLASIVFYCLADWKFISLLAISGLVNFYLAKIIAQSQEGTKRNLLFYSGIIFNIAILLYFKYFNFFIENFVALFNYAGANVGFTPFHILMPLGISFFTFQMVGYLIDVDNEEVEPTNDLIAFFTYLAYFPKILSGPIERVQSFLPQIQKKRTFDYVLAVDGLRQFLWGLFKKMVIANNLLPYIDTIFKDYGNLSGSTLLLGAIFYSIQVYADFSGYSDMACGVSKMFNIRITNNFNFPFFATNISEFWKKWHISLTTWMMDYVFTPLNFLLRKYKKLGLILSVFITFLLVGFWHGANWTFVAFGVLHGLYFIPVIMKGSMNKKLATGNIFPSFIDAISMFSLFLLVSVTTVFFKSENLTDAINYISGLFSLSLFSVPEVRPWLTILLLVGFFVVEWMGKAGEYALAGIEQSWNVAVRWAFYYLLVISIFWFSGSDEQFIYFQF